MLNRFGTGGLALITLHRYFNVAISRINVSVGPDVVRAFFVFGFVVFTTIFPPAAVNARMS
jgi:hypothetical protein